MPKNLDSPVEWVFLGLILLLILVGFIAAQNAEQALEDPNDRARVYLDQLPGLALICGPGLFRITILRQSGNIHAEYEARTATAAIGQAISTFRRAKIDAIRISLNTEEALHFNRLFYSHRGSSEGKKVGSVQIIRVS